MPVIGFVDLDRRFRDRTDAELEHSELEHAETFASLGGLGLGSSIGWTALLEHARVVLLAEAGAGKTTEMVEQAERLAGEGQFAFCVPLESLDRALGRLSREIDSHLDRARVIVSCRPRDWRSSLDLKTMQNRLPVPERVGEIDAPPPEEVFMGALRHEPAEAVSFQSPETKGFGTGHGTDGRHAANERWPDRGFRRAERCERCGHVSCGSSPA